MPELRVEKVLGPAKREIAKGLGAHNIAAVGKANRRAFAVTIRDKGKVIGGVVAETFFGWMFVNMLWVSEHHRGKGFGRSLMEAVEAEARKRGVRNVYLDSFSFQAPKFYIKLGYREFGRLDDFPSGNSRHWMTKAL